MGKIAFFRFCVGTKYDVYSLRSSHIVSGREIDRETEKVRERQREIERD